MIENSLRPYFEAVKQILDGTHVTELEKLRYECNKRFHQENPSMTSREIMSYDAELVIIGFYADAENKILMGADPIKEYSGIKNLEPTQLREHGRKITEEVIKHYLD